METSAFAGYLFAAILTLVNGIFIFVLRNLHVEIRSTNKRVEALEQRKPDCQREFVSTESWVRSEAYTRRKLDQLVESVAAMQGSLKVVEQLPSIMGQITREIFKAARENKL